MIKLKSLIPEDIKDKNVALGAIAEKFGLQQSMSYEYAPGKFRKGYIVPYDIELNWICKTVRCIDDFKLFQTYNMQPKYHYFGLNDKTRKLMYTCILEDQWKQVFYYDRNYSSGTRYIYTKPNEYHYLNNSTSFVDMMSRSGNYEGFIQYKFLKDFKKYSSLDIKMNTSLSTNDNIFKIRVAYNSQMRSVKETWKFFDELESHVEQITDLFDFYHSDVHTCYVRGSADADHLCISINPLPNTNGINMVLDSVTFET